MSTIDIGIAEPVQASPTTKAAPATQPSRPTPTVAPMPTPPETEAFYVGSIKIDLLPQP